ncbi:hypothetical protein HDU96_004043 [Phlyctochytrium bullatum]|nr:hypothetical protein HDU96_004043 [Phlyctochytrium bullatum]
MASKRNPRSPSLPSLSLPIAIDQLIYDVGAMNAVLSPTTTEAAFAASPTPASPAPTPVTPAPTFLALHDAGRALSGASVATNDSFATAASYSPPAPTPSVPILPTPTTPPASPPTSSASIHPHQQYHQAIQAQMYSYGYYAPSSPATEAAPQQIYQPPNAFPPYAAYQQHHFAAATTPATTSPSPLRRQPSALSIASTAAASVSSSAAAAAAPLRRQPSALSIASTTSTSAPAPASAQITRSPSTTTLATCSPSVLGLGPPADSPVATSPAVDCAPPPSRAMSRTRADKRLTSYPGAVGVDPPVAAAPTPADAPTGSAPRQLKRSGSFIKMFGSGATPTTAPTKKDPVVATPVAPTPTPASKPDRTPFFAWLTRSTAKPKPETPDPSAPEPDKTTPPRGRPSTLSRGTVSRRKPLRAASASEYTGSVNDGAGVESPPRPAQGTDTGFTGRVVRARSVAPDARNRDTPVAPSHGLFHPPNAATPRKRSPSTPAPVVVGTAAACPPDAEVPFGPPHLTRHPSNPHHGQLRRVSSRSAELGGATPRPATAPAVQTQAQWAAAQWYYHNSYAGGQPYWAPTLYGAAPATPATPAPAPATPAPAPATTRSPSQGRSPSSDTEAFPKLVRTKTGAMVPAPVGKQRSRSRGGGKGSSSSSSSSSSSPVETGTTAARGSSPAPSNATGTTVAGAAAAQTPEVVPQRPVSAASEVEVGVKMPEMGGRGEGAASPLRPASCESDSTSHQPTQAVGGSPSSTGPREAKTPPSPPVAAVATVTTATAAAATVVEDPATLAWKRFYASASAAAAWADHALQAYAAARQASVAAGVEVPPVGVEEVGKGVVPPKERWSWLATPAGWVAVPVVGYGGGKEEGR